jgi:glycogen debranching enzyme
VRGMHRERRGERLPVALAADNVTLSYCGLDGLVRATRLAFQPAPQTLTAGSAMFDLELGPHGQATIFLEVACTPEIASRHSPRAAFLAAYIHAKRRLRSHASRGAVISSPHEDFDETLRRSANDLRMLITEKPTGPYPYAGIPWFSTAFGRDALITALLMLALDPTLARGVLQYLAQEQATEFDPKSEAEPGKILHEMRGGEMAALREVPFRRYYGSVDSTPLFVMLAGAYLDRTGDLVTLRALWSHIDRALGWMDLRADADGFVRYQRSTEDGLANQGWKDSYDAIFSCRRNAGTWVDRAVRGAGICVCGTLGRGIDRPAARVRPAGGGAGGEGRGFATGVRGAILVRTARHLRDRAGWRRAAMRGPFVQCWAPADDGDCRSRAGPPGGEGVDGLALF